MAAEQRRSNPPQAAIVLNDMMVETLEMSADAFQSIAASDQISLQGYVYEADRLTPAFDAEEERVFGICR